MFTNIGLPKAGGFWLALFTVLGLGLMPLAMPATAQGRPNVQPMSGTHATVVLPNRDTHPTNWPRRQPVLNVQPCGANLYAYGYNLFATPSFGNQSCAAPCPNSAMQGTLDDPDMTSWYGYNRSEVAWWSSNPNSNLNPFSSCNGFQGWWTP
jgi:hypothetical protein